jgi:hypothetical protein
MSTYTLNNSATDIDSALQKVVGATTTPTDLSPLMVTSGGVKAYVDTQDTALETSVGVVEADVAALQATVNSLITGVATLTLPQTAYTDSRVVTGWVKSDPNGYINYTSSSTFSLNINNKTKAGQYSATIVLTANDEDTGSDAHSLEFYKNGVKMSSMTIPLNNAQYSNGGFRTKSWNIANGDSWYVRMYESPTNTATVLSATKITITKIT